MAQLKQRLLCGLLVVGLGLGCGAHDDASAALVTESQAQPSPSGTFTASLSTVDDRGAQAWKVVLHDQQGREVYRSATSFAARHRTIVTWEPSSDRLWVYSGDVGTRVLAQDDQGVWQERSSAGLTAPEPIQKMYDRLGIKPRPKAS